MTKIYVAGPMRGKPELNFPAFNAAAEGLREIGWDVVNPVDINPDPKAEWRDCMNKDIVELVHCDAIYMLVGWENSKGASLEHHIAVELGLDLYYEEDDFNNDKRTDDDRVDGEVGSV